MALLKKYPEFLKQWRMYSEDKRTEGGFWVSEDSFEVGSFDAAIVKVRYPSLEEAVAEFIVRELDYWLDLGER